MDRTTDATFLAVVDRASIGARIRARRQELRLSQRDIAAPGLSYAYISRIEAGTRSPSVKALRELAPRLQTTVHGLETGEDDPALALATLVLDHRETLPREAARLARRIVGGGI